MSNENLGIKRRDTRSIGINEKKQPILNANAQAKFILARLIITCRQLQAHNITGNDYGKGTLTYIGTYPSQELLDAVVRRVAEQAGVISSGHSGFPVIRRSGVNRQGRNIHYIFNYSGAAREVTYDRRQSEELISGATVKTGDVVKLEPWDVLVMEEK